MAKRRLSRCPVCSGLVEHHARCIVTRAAAANAAIRAAYEERDALIRSARAAGVPQKMLAEALGVSKGLIQQTEKASPG